MYRPIGKEKIRVKGWVFVKSKGAIEYIDCESEALIADKFSICVCTDYPELALLSTLIMDNTWAIVSEIPMQDVSYVSTLLSLFAEKSHKVVR
jgi:hypothetical protein